MDSFWTHVFYILNEIVDFTNPIYFFNPHNWFYYTRRDTDEAIISSTKNKQRQILLTVLRDDYLDRKAKSELRDEYYQFNINPKFAINKDNYYISIIGDYITEIFIDEKISKNINLFFKETKRFGEKEEKELENIISQLGKNKFVISRDRKRAEKLKKILGKDFYIKK